MRRARAQISRGKATSAGKARRSTEWLLFFYSLPSRPVKNRMKVWRKLAKMGAAQLKGSVYILPYGEEHYEMLQWLVSEVASMGGEGAFIRTARIESMEDGDIVELFKRTREKDYQAMDREIKELDTRLASIRKGSIPRLKALVGRLDKLTREFEEVRKIDFFSSSAGASRKGRLDELGREISALAGQEAEKPEVKISRKDITDYQGKTWVTRPKPFVDRMATAWLIRRFIDREAVFDFSEETASGRRREGTVMFDVRDGDFTHVADMCTFEVVMRSFGLKEKVLRKIAELVHNLDLKDRKFDVPESRGIEDILSGIRKTSRNDMEMLEKGMGVFDMLYVSKA